MRRYTADFETATWFEDETYVWAWAICEIGSFHIDFGNNIDSFINYCKNSNNSVFYFHNLKFDGEFILYWLLTNNFIHIKDKKERKDKTFTTLITDMGQFYEITVYFEVGNKKVKKVTFIDSLKIIPFSVEQIAKSFNLEISKLKIDYKKYRSRSHILTEEEKAYIKNDVLIVAKALNSLFNQNLKRMTQGSNALFEFKNLITERRFDILFPRLEKWADSDIRKAYKGGFTFVNPDIKEKEVEKGTILDVNSLYPWVLYEKELPYKEGIFFEGKYKTDKIYPLYIQNFTCCFELKKNKIPIIQLKNKEYMWEYLPNEYVTSSYNNIINLCLTNIDMKLFFENYEVTELTYLNGWKFKSQKGLFKEYIDKWISIKNESARNGNKGMRTLAKLMLNSLYGKFATTLEGRKKIPYLSEEGIIKYHIDEKEDKNGLYLPIGVFVTSYAREKTIRTSQAITDYSIKKYGYSKYFYSDTDSIHSGLTEEELKQFCEIDEYKLGAWKCEGHFKKAKFIRQKCYIENIDDELHVTCAGLPKKCLYKKDENSKKYYYKTLVTTKEGKEKEVEKELNMNDFKVGFMSLGKLRFKHVKGGVILVDTDFTLKEEKILKNIVKDFNK